MEDTKGGRVVKRKRNGRRNTYFTEIGVSFIGDYKYPDKIRYCFEDKSNSVLEALVVLENTWLSEFLWKILCEGKKITLGNYPFKLTVPVTEKELKLLRLIKSTNSRYSWGLWRKGVENIKKKGKHKALEEILLILVGKRIFK